MKDEGCRVQDTGWRIVGAFLLQVFVCLLGGYTSLAVFVARKRLDDILDS
jgi:hypothetical protein